MSDSTTTLDLISASQSQKETTANALFDAASPAMLYGRRALTTAGLTWGYYGGCLLAAGAVVTVANGTVTLTASATNYVEANATTGAVTVNTSSFTGGKVPLYEIVTGASSVTSYSDKRTTLAGSAALADGDKGDVVVSGSGATWTIDSGVLSAFGRTLIDDADAATARATLGLAIGTNVQAYSATLAALSALTSAANKGVMFTGSGTAATYDLTAAGLALLDDADAAAQRTTLGLGSAATLAADTDTTLSADSDLRTPTQKAVKAYVDSVATGGATITLTGDVTGSGTGSFAATIANGAVTYAKMQNVSAASKLLGRGDSGAGDVQEITLGTGLSMTGTTLSASGGGGSSSLDLVSYTFAGGL
jgi:hypothetical protein